jgi:hypothetical protein
MRYILILIFVGSFFCALDHLANKASQKIQPGSVYQFPILAKIFFVIPPLILGYVSVFQIHIFADFSAVIFVRSVAAVGAVAAVFAVTMRISITESFVTKSGPLGAKTFPLAEIDRIESCDWRAEFIVHTRTGKKLTIPYFVQDAKSLAKHLRQQMATAK